MKHLIRTAASILPVMTLLLLLPRTAITSAPANDEADRPMSLVFSDDFSTDPNTNGLWAIHRYAGDLDLEAGWDANSQTWYLNRVGGNLGVAVFAKYELTAHNWKAEFLYKVGHLGGVNGGGDGFVFMFYKDKQAYGRPEYGMDMGFAVVPFQTVPGYGLEFDNYYSGRTCDPTPNNYIAVRKDDVCDPPINWREDTRTADNLWHTLVFTFTEGKMRIEIDGETTWIFNEPDPDYTFAGIGFSSGTGSAVEDVQVDNFRLWVRQ